MSTANGHVPAVVQPTQPPEMDVPRGGQRIQEENRKAELPDRGSIATKGIGSSKYQDKQSLNYALRSALAGGLAACAVCVPSSNQLQ